MARHPNRASESSRLRIVFCSCPVHRSHHRCRRGIGSSRATGQHVEPPSQGYGVPRDNVFHLKIAPWVIEHTANGQQAEFFVVLADQADLRRAATLAHKS